MHIALQHLRVTPVDSHLPSPSEMLFNRPICINLPSRLSITAQQRYQEIQQRLKEHRDHMAKQYNRTAGLELPELTIERRVQILNKDRHHWYPREVVARCNEPRSYIILQTPKKRDASPKNQGTFT